MAKTKTKINLIGTDASEKKFEYKVHQEILALTPRKNGNAIRFDVLSWNGGTPKVEIRLWATKEGEFKPTKGLSMSAEEFKELITKLSELEVE